MTRGRKPKPTIQTEILDPARDVQTEQGLTAMRDEEMALKFVIDYEEPLRQIGQLEALEFTRRVADVATAQIFENMRNSGKYKGLPYLDENGNTRRVASIEEFCEAKLGKSYRRCLDLSQNLRTLGPDLYEQTERLGLRNIDYKAIRSLAAPEQELIRRAVEEAQSRDEVLDLLQELAAKHAREKEEITRQVEDLQGECRAKEELLAERNRERDALQEKLFRRTLETLEEKVVKARKDAEQSSMVVRGTIDGPLRRAVMELQEARASAGVDNRMFLAGLFGEISIVLDGLREEFAIPDVRELRDNEFEWIYEAGDETKGDVNNTGGAVS